MKQALISPLNPSPIFYYSGQSVYDGVERWDFTHDLAGAFSLGYLDRYGRGLSVCGLSGPVATEKQVRVKDFKVQGFRSSVRV